VLDPRVSAKPFLYTYDPRASVVAQLAMPTGQTIAYARDAQGRLLSTTLSGTARQTLATHAYTYDLAGQRTTATTASATTAYTYDALRQLATATETPAGTGQTPTREFAYAYDPIGNRLTAATATETTTYTANSVNQYTSIVSQISNSQISDTPTYDANGNTTTLPSGLVLDYDEENRLVSAATLTAREEYTYDGLGRRVERRTFIASTGLTAPATTTRYVYDGWRVLEELTSSQSSPFTLHSSYTRGLDLSGTLEGAGGIGGLLSMTRDPAGSATSAYYFHDGNGNVSTLVSASDALLASYTYTPFGDTLTASGTWASVNAYRFSAKECDAFTSLYYYGLRYYSLQVGRWINRDPIQERGGVNLYGMVANNPVNFWDYLGFCCEGEVSDWKIEEVYECYDGQSDEEFLNGIGVTTAAAAALFGTYSNLPPTPGLPSATPSLAGDIRDAGMFVIGQVISPSVDWADGVQGLTSYMVYKIKTRRQAIATFGISVCVKARWKRCESCWIISTCMKDKTGVYQYETRKPRPASADSIERAKQEAKGSLYK
jgi:RHS repeat-associated protein